MTNGDTGSDVSLNDAPLSIYTADSEDACNLLSVPIRKKKGLDCQLVRLAMVHSGPWSTRACLGDRLADVANRPGQGLPPHNY